MSFITFIYRVGNNPKTYYGKYCGDISDDHEGLDKEVYWDLVHGLNKYRKKNGKPKLTSKIHIGILSFSSDRYIPVYSSERENKCFDFYYYENKTYINGKLV